MYQYLKISASQEGKLHEIGYTFAVFVYARGFIRNMSKTSTLCLISLYISINAIKSLSLSRKIVQFYSRAPSKKAYSSKVSTMESEKNIKQSCNNSGSVCFFRIAQLTDSVILIYQLTRHYFQAHSWLSPLTLRT